jgi:predicted RNase H-like HicB family nuclease
MTSRKMRVPTSDALTNRATTILAKPYTRRLTPDVDGGYTATIQEFPGCVADGETSDEAITNLERAALSWVEAQLDLGQSVPEPVALYGYSGKLALRIPRGLHKRVAEQALSEGVSINQFLATAISSFVGAKSIADKLIDQLKPALFAQTHLLGPDPRLVVHVHGHWEPKTTSSSIRTQYIEENKMHTLSTLTPTIRQLSYDHG